MPLDIFTGAQKEADAFTTTRPGWGPGLDPSFGESFGAAWNSVAGSWRTLRVQASEAHAVQDWSAAFEKEAGYAPIQPDFRQPTATQYDALRKAYDAEKLKRPDLAIPEPPTQETAHAGAIDKERKLLATDAAVQARPQTFGSRVGSVLGGIAGSVVDPINLASMAAGGPAGGILTTALRDAAIVGTSQAAISVSGLKLSQEVNPNYGFGDVASEAGQAAIGGAVLGGGIRALAKAWARLSGRGRQIPPPAEPPPAPAPEAPEAAVQPPADIVLPETVVQAEFPRDVKDAGNVVPKREPAPYASSPADYAARSMSDLQQGREAIAPLVAKTPEGAARFAKEMGWTDLEQAWKDFPRDVVDAGNVVTREAAIADANPHRGAGPEGEIAHTQAYQSAEKAVADGQPVEITPFSPRPSEVIDSSGRKVGVKYEVVEADTLIASHNPDLSINPAYPAELQPRDRTRAVSADQITGIASRLEPTRLGPAVDAAHGAPIVGPDDVVESGNGRKLAIDQVYATNGEKAAAYRQFLADQGFDTAGMTNPVLIARRTTPLEGADRAAFTDAANRASVLRMSAPEQAMADGRLIDGPMLDKLQGGLLSAEARPFVRAFIKELPAGERGGMVDREGNLSQEGQRRVEAALLARAYGEPTLLARILEGTDSNTRALAAALTDVSARWSAMRDAVARGDVPAGMDLTKDLLDAFRLVAKARDEGQKLKMLVDQAEMFDAPTANTRKFLALMFRNEDLTQAASRQAAARGLTGYADEAVKNTVDANLFGEAPLAAGDVLSSALKKAGREDLAAPAEQATLPLAARKAMIDPKADDAAIHQLDHLQEQTPDLMVADPTGTLNADGTPVMVSVKSLVDQADAEINAAQEIGDCAIGKMTPAAA